MKKISLALIAGLLTNMISTPVLADETPKISEEPQAVTADLSVSKFSRWSIAYGGTYDINSSDSTLSLTHGNFKMATPLKGGLSKFYLDVGYTHVMENNFLFGISLYNGIDFNQVDNTNSKWKTADNIDFQINSSTVFMGIWFLGVKFKAGMVVTPDIAIKGIFEINETYYLSNYVDKKGAFIPSGALGIGIDYALTDTVFLGVGAKYKLLPKTVELNRRWYANGDVVTSNISEEFTYDGNRMEIFAEISFKYQ